MKISYFTIFKLYLGYILAALASVPVYGMAIAEHNAFHNILTEMQNGKNIQGAQA